MNSNAPARSHQNRFHRVRNRTLGAGTLIFQKDLLGMSASVAYYTVLALTPFLLLFFGFLGFFGWRNSPEVRDEITRVLGPAAAIVLNSLQTRLEQDQGILAFSILGFLTLIISATGVITQLQVSLDEILFEPNLSPAAETISANFEPAMIATWLHTKVLSVLTLIFCVFIATMTLVSTVAIRVLLPIESQIFWHTLTALGSFVIFWLVFTGMFRYLPNLAQCSWRFCWKAGALCSTLFLCGKWGMEFFFTHSGIESSYGALSSFVIFLLWAYYNGLTILLSACLAKGFFK